MSEKYEKFIEELHSRFPVMYSEKYGGIAVGEGWWPLIMHLSHTIQSHIDHSKGKCPQVIVAQVKEKFGSLRFYYDGGDDFVHGAVWLAESLAGSMCEECGAPGKRTGDGWVRTLCDVHIAEREALMAEQARMDGLEL